MERKKEKKKRVKKKVLVLVLILLIALIGSGTYYYQTYYKKTGNNEEEKPKEPEKKITIVNPDSTSRPYAIMINNVEAARRLQCGLQDAYIVYEMIVEGGITRYMALYMDANIERIGSVRSSRHYFLDFALENDAVYVHHGQSPRAQSDFSTLGIDRIVVDDSKTGWRDNTLTADYEHKLFTSIAKLDKGNSKRKTRNKDLLLNYSVDPIDLSQKENAIEAKTINIPYSDVTTTSYEYDEENGVYKRFVNEKAHVDYVTKKQYTFKNIITYKIKNTGDSSGRQDLDLIDSGEGYYITNGYAIPITWSKTSRSNQTVYRYESGEILDVNDGNTFIQIQPLNKKLTIN